MPTTFNTDSPRPAYVYDSTDDVWYPLAGVAPGSSVDRYYFTATSGATSISGVDNNGATLAYTAGTEQVYLNGVLLVRTDDYTATNGTSITGLAALTTNDIVEVITFNPSNIEKTSAILSTSINAKGDLIAGTADNTAGILSVGTAGQYLKVDSSTATGLTWGDPGDLTAVSAGTGITVTNGTGPIPSVALTTPVSATNGGTAQSTYTTGDMLYASAANTLAKLSIGTTSQTLTVVDGIPSWVTPSSGGMTLISTTTLTGASVTLSSIPQIYNDLRLVLRNPLPATDGSYLQLQYNGVTTNQYFGSVNPYYAYNPILSGYFVSAMDIAGTTGLDNSVTNSHIMHEIYDYTNSTTFKITTTYAVTTDPTTTTSHYFGSYPAIYRQTTAISSILIKMNSGNMTSGTALLYGIK
jgi:hypothetical protein